VIITEMPSKPRNPKFNVSSQMLSIHWEAPNNIDRFDLYHYIVQVHTDHEPNLLSGTTRDLSYHFDLGKFASRSYIVIYTAEVIAVSKCTRLIQGYQFETRAVPVTALHNVTLNTTVTLDTCNSSASILHYPNGE
jgi:hypothetical protein